MILAVGTTTKIHDSSSSFIHATRSSKVANNRKNLIISVISRHTTTSKSIMTLTSLMPCLMVELLSFRSRCWTLSLKNTKPGKTKGNRLNVGGTCATQILREITFCEFFAKIKMTPQFGKVRDYDFYAKDNIFSVKSTFLLT